MGEPDTPEGTTVADALRHWLFSQALPLWQLSGVDRAVGGYFEELGFDGEPIALDYKRTRVTGRQLYVFSHAACLGVQGAAEAADFGAQFLFRHVWQGEAAGWARSVRSNGDPLDTSADLYDQAFALFGLAWFGHASGDPRAWAHAERTVAFVETHMAHDAGGYVPSLPFAGQLQQNPLMHLLEASLAAFRFSGKERFAGLALRLADLFEARLFDPVTGTLAETFHPDWRREISAGGVQIEPGHQFEWTWILSELHRLLGRDLRHAACRLAQFAQSHGVEPDTGATWDIVNAKGSPLQTTSRLWTNCERIKAAVALAGTDHTVPGLEWESSASLLLDRYLPTQRPGLWVDRFRPDGRALSESVPASSLYHLMFAATEALQTGP